MICHQTVVYSTMKKITARRHPRLVVDELHREAPGDAAAANGDLEVIIVEVAVAHADDGGSPAEKKCSESPARVLIKTAFQFFH